MREDLAAIHPANLAAFAEFLASIGVGLVYDPDEHLREWKALQERKDDLPMEES